MKRKCISASQQNFGLIAWLEQTRVTLPLKGVECRFDVTGAVASVELDQIYHQDAARPLDCTYTFPLPAGAAVYRCELHVNGRVIRAKVEAKEGARKRYRREKAAGRRAALVETERENLFTLSLGNLQPGDLIVVRFAWFQMLDRSGDALRLLVPTCPGVRYIPGKPLLRDNRGRGSSDDTDQVPDASRISPPRIEALHPDAAYVSFEGRLFSGEVAAGTVSSPSHPIYVRETAEALSIELSGRQAVPDRDFVLAWQEPKANTLEPRAWHWTEGKETYALVQLRAPETVEVASHFPQDLYFLIDRSGSMQGMKWERTCEALHSFVKLLGEEDRVWITLFESTYLDFAEAPMPAPQVLADRGFQRMAGMGTAGGTELLPAAQHVLASISEHSDGRRAVVVLITDGQVGNEAEVLAAFRLARHMAVHTFGIDTAVNDAFLKTLARQHRGGCWLQTPDDDIAGTIAALGDRLRRPVLTGLALSAPWQGTGDGLPDLHARELVTISLRGTAAVPVEITGHRPEGGEQSIKVGLGPAGSEAIRLLWARERIAHLLASRQGEEAVTLAKKHNLLCEGAAFVAWDEAEQVQIAREEIVQPAVESRMLYSQQQLRSHILCANVGSREELCSFLDELPPSLPLLERVTRLSLQEAALPAATIEAILSSFFGDGLATEEKGRQLLNAAELIAQFRGKDIFGPLREAMERTLPPLQAYEVLVQWADQVREPFKTILEVEKKLTEAGAPRRVVEYLLAWILAERTLDRDRLFNAQVFVARLDRLPFSTGATERHWQTFVDGMGTSPAGSKAPPWVGEPELAGS